MISSLFKSASILLAIVVMACNNGTAGSDNLSVLEFQKQLKAASDAQLLDVRTPEEFKGGHLEHALNYDWNGSDFDAQMNTLDKNKPTFVYCLSGGRSGAAASYMREHGFKKVYEMQGGMMSWRAQNLAEVIDLATEKKAGMSKADFEKEVAMNEKVLVDVYAEWCMPCKKMAPFLEEIAKERSDVKVMRINADEHMNLCKELGIEGLPVVMYYVNGKSVWRKDGFQSKQDLLNGLKQ